MFVTISTTTTQNTQINLGKRKQQKCVETKSDDHQDIGNNKY